jgi:uncharacterized protein (DUF983 family)
MKSKKLAAGRTEQPTSFENPVYTDYSKLFGKTSFQVFCPKCDHGPMFTADTGLLCQRCGKKLIVVQMKGGDYKVEVLE